MHFLMWHVLYNSYKKQYYRLLVHYQRNVTFVTGLYLSWAVLPGYTVDMNMSYEHSDKMNNLGFVDTDKDDVQLLFYTLIVWCLDFLKLSYCSGWKQNQGDLYGYKNVTGPVHYGLIDCFSCSCFTCLSCIHVLLLEFALDACLLSVFDFWRCSFCFFHFWKGNL